MDAALAVHSRAPRAPRAITARFALVGLLVASFLVALGSLWAFERGAQDFSVFFASWKAALEGRGADVYHATPDRFLYAPGFAWLLAPLALLPQGVALALWCFGKAAVVGWVVRELNLRLTRPGDDAPAAIAGASAFAVVLVARPLLIDLQYGQVNIYILGACLWALLGHCDARAGGPGRDAVRWAVLAVAAVVKLVALPLLLVPWLVPAGLPRDRLRAARAGTLAGAAFVLALPVFFVGPATWLALLGDWREALVSRGLPLETHNQSFAALLYHYTSGLPIRIIAQGGVERVLGPAWLSVGTIGLLSLGWALVSAGVLLGWLVSWRSRPPLAWISVLVGLLIVPSHLVWKPYFVLTLPAAAVVVDRALRRFDWSAALALVVFAAINLTGFDFVGAEWGGRLEAASLFLLAHLALLAACAAAPRRDLEV